MGLLDGFARRLMPSPAGGLLSEEDIHNARRQGLLGLGASLLSNSGQSGNTLANIGSALQAGQGTYQGAVDQTMNRQGAQQQMQLGQQKLQLGQHELSAAQAAQQQAAQLAATRKAIIDEHPIPQDVGGMVPWIETVLPKFMAAGDEEYAQRLTAILATRGSQGVKEQGTYVTTPGPNGQPMRKWVSQEEARQGVPEYQAPRQSMASSRPITLINPDTGKAEVALYDPQTENFRFTGQTPSSIGAGSEAERKNQAIYELSAPHVAMLDAADSPNRIEQLALNGKLNEFLTQNRQLWDVSGRQIADAYLRLTTGAAYNKEELEQAVILMTPRPGDTPAVIQLKRENRQRLVRALRAAAGRSFQESPDLPMPGVQSGSSSTAPAADGTDLRSRYGRLR